MNTVQKQFRDKELTDIQLRQCRALLNQLVKFNVPPEELNKHEHVLVGIEDAMRALNTSKDHCANFNQAAWYGQYLKGIVSHHKAELWLSGDEAVKAYDAEALATAKITCKYNGKFLEVRPVAVTSDWATYANNITAICEFAEKVTQRILSYRYECERNALAAFEAMPDKTAKPTKLEHDGFVVRMERHDFYYDYSDDNSVWRRGMESEKEIDAVAAKNPHFNQMWGTFRKLTIDQKSAEIRTELNKLRVGLAD